MSNLRFLLEKPETEPDGIGGYRKHWINVGYFWGSITKTSAKSEDVGAVKASYKKHALCIRDLVHTEAGEGWRLRLGNRLFYVAHFEKTIGNLSYLEAMEEIGHGI